mgnify:CR=1 FL=1
MGRGERLSRPTSERQAESPTPSACATAGIQDSAGAERERTEILSSAYSEAEKIRGEGDATAAETYASAFNRDPEFYAFWRSLTAYREVFSKGGDVMVLKPDSEFFRFLNQKQQN